MVASLLLSLDPYKWLEKIKELPPSWSYILAIGLESTIDDYLIVL